jgi:tRNA threonylcarbamoyl adenosine modification protein (Sua5/YciO/YrdC/YwlC family)
MSARYDCSDAVQRAAGISAAIEAVREGELVVLPTDTVYGIAADAFTPEAVARLLAAKGRGRDMPPPVLVGTVRAAEALVEDLGAFGRDLIDEFWPGALTLVCTASKSLRWDLGDTKGTVAVRMPLHGVALDLLKQSGPLAVSSANLSGSPAATTVDEAQAQLGSAVSVYLDGGPCLGGVASTILDLTPTIPRLLRAGAIDVDRLRAVAAVITGDDSAGPEAPEADTAGPEAPEADTTEAPETGSAGPEAVGPEAVGPEFKPAAPHPLAGGPPEASGGGTPPSA